MKTFINDPLIAKAADNIINNYEIGYINFNYKVFYIQEKTKESGATAYNILNECEFFTPEIKELFKNIDNFCKCAETYPGELDSYNPKMKAQCLKALCYEIRKYFLFSEIQPGNIILTKYNQYLIVDSISNNGTIKAHDRKYNLIWSHSSNVKKYKAPHRPTQTNKLFNPAI